MDNSTATKKIRVTGFTVHHIHFDVEIDATATGSDVALKTAIAEQALSGRRVESNELAATLAGAEMGSLDGVEVFEIHE